MGAEELAERLRQLEAKLDAQDSFHGAEASKLQGEVAKLQKTVSDLEGQYCNLDVVGGSCKTDWFMREVQWKITNFTAKEQEISKGTSIWSPKFRAAGLDSLQLEFFPKGREKTTHEGFCSLFLWCPSGTKIKYQLFVGGFIRAPDEDEYCGRIGHGHSNFCPVAPEVNREDDSIVVGAKFIEVHPDEAKAPDGNAEPPPAIKILNTPVEDIVAKEAEILRNSVVNRVVWRIEKVREKAQQLPKGASMWSRLFSAAGISDILLEFYPNGSTNTTKDGHCAFYLRCPEGVSLIVTLFVGKARKGPIKTTFDSLTGKGLPDFCALEEQIDPDDGSLELGIELQNQAQKTLKIET